MTAVWMRARSNLKRGWRGVLALGIVVGLVGGVVMASASAARRASTAYDRFLVATGSPDAGVFSRTSRIPTAAVEKIRALPQVADAVLITQPGVFLTDERGRELFEAGANVFWAPFEHPGSRWFRPKVVAGRLPDPDRADEVAVVYNPTPLVHLGDRLIAKVARSGADELGFPEAPRSVAATVPVKVVGVVLMVTGLEPRTEGEVFVTPAFQRTYGDGAETGSTLLVRLRHGAADAPSFGAAVARVAPDLQPVDFSAEAGRAARQSAPQTTALWLFALLAGVFGVLLFGLTIVRAIFGESAENSILRALGMSRRQFAGVAGVRGLAVGLVGSGIALVVAGALSPLAPFGLARLVDPAPGFALDAWALGTGALAIVVLSVLLSVPAAIRAGAPDPSGRAWSSWRARPSGIAGLLSRSGLSPSAAVGARLALEPGRGRTAVPVRSTLVGVVFSIAGLSLAFGFGASLHHLLETPRLYGIDWDVNVHLWDTQASDPYVDALRSDRAVQAFSGGNLLAGNQGADVVVGTPGHRVRTSPWGLDGVRGSVTPTVIDGRWPSSDDEIALGTKTLRAVSADLGDVLRVAADGPPVSMRVVGRAVFPELAPGAAGIGHGAGLTLHALQRLSPGIALQDVLIRLAPGVDARDFMRRTSQHLGDSALVAPGDGLFTGLQELRSSEVLPLVLSGVLALAAVVTLAHTLVDSIRRRRRDLAILKTFGFVRRQVSATVAWQAATLAGVSLLVGLPLGVAGARWGWSLLADRLAVVSEPVVPPFVLLLIPATIALATLVAIVPGRIASRIRPALVLRAE